MKNITRHTGTLQLVERLNNSRNGNPRYKLLCDGYVFVTAPDSAHGYGVPNFFDKEVEITIGTYYGKRTMDTIKLAKSV